ncbi:MAG TPA: DUF5320 domain-containing protein [Candidatus Paceibacterota bacterium]|nr:DUF5320 domain-containing protein [Candidatus Paceibacterota bacterium]
MPRFDGTGPNGQGPMTGRGLGPCADGRPRVGWRRYFRGFGRRFGLGGGFGRDYSNQPSMTKDEKKEWLQTEKEAIEEELKDLHNE